MEIPDPGVRVGQAETAPQIPLCRRLLPGFIKPTGRPSSSIITGSTSRAPTRPLVPQRRGPKWKSRRVYGYIEQQVLQQRQQGVNRYEICQLLAPKLKHLTPSPSTVYRITQRYGLNRLTPKLHQEKRRIVKQKAGELGHLDCHYLSKDLIATDPTALLSGVRARRLYPPGVGRGGARSEESDGDVQRAEELQLAESALPAPICGGLNGQWLGRLRPRAPKIPTRLNGCCWSWGLSIGIPGRIGPRRTGRWNGSGGR